MPSTTNVHLATERGVSFSGRLATNTHSYTWHTLALTVNTEANLGEYEVTFYLNSKQLETFAAGLEKLAAEVRKAADIAALKAEQRPPLSAFAQQLVRVASEGIGSGLPDDVEQRR